MNRERMDESVRGHTVKPSGKSIPNGTPGKASGNGVSNAPFAFEGIDSGDRTSPWPADVQKGFEPGSGKTQNSPNS